jgi:hypothetical protein
MIINLKQRKNFICAEETTQCIPIMGQRKLGIFHRDSAIYTRKTTAVKKYSKVRDKLENIKKRII